MFAARSVSNMVIGLTSAPTNANIYTGWISCHCNIAVNYVFFQGISHKRTEEDAAQERRRTNAAEDQRKTTQGRIAKFVGVVQQLLVEQLRFELKFGR